MKPDHPFARLMAQASTLTRRGSLAEATQAIQRALHLHRHEPAPPAEAADSVIVLDGLVREVDPCVDAPDTPAPPTPARFDELPFATAQGLRHYKLFCPAGLADDRAAPLVLMLHGCKQNPDDFAIGTRMNEAAQERGWRVLYPAQPPRSNGHRCWNWFQPGDQQRGQGEPALLAAITRHVMKTHAVDAGHVYVAGLSAGGAMAAILANEYPDLFAAVGVHSGLPQGAAHDVATAFHAMKHGPRAATRAPRMPLIVFHGDHDTTVHPRNSELLLAGDAPAEVDTGMVEGGHAWVRSRFRDASGRLVTEHWLVHGSGHAWQGGSPKGSYTDAQGPDASREMLRFFAQHQLTPP
ncbi:extracellular catalytic domain type 1 short-chain-length polyhydroxyalkanoate depolymerase [Sphaerotilaceae bacterium SBD11-9]